jgi:hypothetical protein
LRAQKEVRTTLLQGLGGAALLVGAYVTYRQLQTSREGQITERFTRAIDQLGSEHLDVRLGGLYALERIARDSPADRAIWMGQTSTAPSWRGQSLTTARPGRTGSTGAQQEWRRRK